MRASLSLLHCVDTNRTKVSWSNPSCKKSYYAKAPPGHTATHAHTSPQPHTNSHRHTAAVRFSSFFFFVVVGRGDGEEIWGKRGRVRDQRVVCNYRKGGSGV